MVMDSNKSVTANFVREFVLTTLADPPEAGTVSGGGVHPDGTKVEVHPQSNQGWMFVGWSGACSGLAPCVLIMDSDKTVTAHFTVG